MTEAIIFMVVILVLPRLFVRLRLPGLVGLILGGMMLGPRVLNLITADSTILRFTADVGELMVMFFAGLEIDLERFARTAHKSVTYGILTFLVPLSTGLSAGRMFGLSWNASVLIGSLLASHTLLALPILMQYRIVQREAMTVTIGATMFTDVTALVVLAACIAIHTVGFSGSILTMRLVGLVIYVPAVLFGARWLGHRFVRQAGQTEDQQALTILVLVAMAAVGAEAVHMEGIVGAFIVGL